MSTNNTFDSLTPQYAIPSEPQMHEMISDQTRVMHTVIEAEGAGGTWTLPLPKDFKFRKYYISYFQNFLPMIPDLDHRGPHPSYIIKKEYLPF